MSAAAAKPPAKKRLYEYSLIVGEVVDGDTFKASALSLGLSVYIHDKRVRLAGVNTPEVHNSDNELELKAGAKVRDIVSELFPVGVKAVVETTSTQEDKYGRLPARVWIPGTDIELGAWLLEHALGVEYHGESRKPFDNSFLEAILNVDAAELVAKVASTTTAVKTK